MKKLIYTLVILAFAVSLNAQWTVVNSSTTSRIESMAVTDANTVYIVGFAQNSTFNLKTTNGGLNWTTFANSPMGGLSVYFLNANTGFLNGPGIHRTTNAGNSWTTVYTPTDTALFISFHFLNANTGYGVGFVYSQQQLFNTAAIKTTNGGLNWTRLTPPITGANKQLNDVFFTDANTGYVVGWSSNPAASIFLKTTNGGNNWNPVGSVYSGEMYSVEFTDANTGYVGGSTPMGILKTTNAGVTWNPIYNIGYQRMRDICFINANTGFAIGDDGVVRTNDAGATWTNQNNTYTQNVQLQIRFFGNYAGYVCGKDGIMLKTTNGGSVFVQNISTEIPSAYSLSQNYPNPFNPTTKIKFDVAPSLSFPNVSIGNPVKLIVYDVMGREVQTLVNESLQPGTYETTFDGSQLTSGVYFYKLTSGDYTATKKLTLIK